MIRAVRIGLVLLTLLTVPVWAYAQQGGHQHGQMAATGKKPAKAAAETPAAHEGGHQGMQGMEKCKEMMAKHDKMVEEMKATDARLDERLAAVKNAKSTDEKVSALEAVVVELSAQRKQMHGLMGDLHHAGMKCGMMGGKMGGMKCPMMGDKPGKQRAMHHGGAGGMGCCAMMKDQQGHGSHASEAPKEDAGKKQ
jgi:hypothetical protein